MLIPIPFRPVLVMSNNDYNRRYQDVIVAAITSNVTDREYQIIITNDVMAEGEPKVDSAIRTVEHSPTYAFALKWGILA
ncbi:type II toxin-antitoxin system PemK/MazF family toxin [Cohnella sp.]|uniref:type II toxin-antitoxin system PemK/MazF family toxin n=1 Tax=Cohnella sp. TaxID=1883426 RepID=UPI003566E8E6